MSRLVARPALALLALCGALLISGCGRGATVTETVEGAPAPPPASPALGAPKTPEDEPEEPADLGFPAFATKNTTRIGSSDPTLAAAAVARSVFPGVSAETRPDAVTLVQGGDWRTALAASVLMSEPIRAPVLFAGTSRTKLPAPTEAALRALDPTGSKPAGAAEVIRVGDVPRPTGRKTTDIAGSDPFVLAQALDAFQAAARGKTSDRVIIASADDPKFAAPAAAYAAKSGDPILFARRNALPAATRAALRTHQQPKIYVLGPPATIGAGVMAELRKLGSVQRIGGADPVRNAIAFASFAETDFGWGVVDPGHGLVFARDSADPALAAAAAPLSAAGKYGPLLLVGRNGTLDEPLETYLQSIQPGYRTDPVRGVYNHGWLVGDTSAMTPTLQGRIDTLLEIMLERTTQAEDQ